MSKQKTKTKKRAKLKKYYSFISIRIIGYTSPYNKNKILYDLFIKLGDDLDDITKRISEKEFSSQLEAKKRVEEIKKELNLYTEEDWYDESVIPVYVKYKER